MNRCAGEDIKQAYAGLNQAYQRVLARYAEDPDKIARIKTAEQAWLVFRDSEIEALFLLSERDRSGSVLSMCRALALAQMTRERTKALRGILEHQEGGVCSQ
jgi:uncharacterized protein YecT (DUF1311 family)